MSKRRRQPREKLRRALIIAWGLVALVISAIAGVASIPASTHPPLSGPELLVYSELDCQHCASWIADLEAHGFRTSTYCHPFPRANGSLVRRACRPIDSPVALVQGYILIGTMPAEAVQCLLAERREARELAMQSRRTGLGASADVDDSKQGFNLVLFTDNNASGIYRFH